MRWVRFGLLLGVATCTAACTVTPPPSPAPTTTTTSVLPPIATSDWPTYHLDNQRSGTQFYLSPPGALSLAWHAKLDGAVYGQPLVVGDAVLAATENDTVYALDTATGQVRWQVHLGTPMPRAGLACGDIDPLGITSTMAYDRVTGRVFALVENAGGSHTLVGIGVKAGQVEVQVQLDPPKGRPIDHQQRSALTVQDDQVFVAYGGLAGDCGNYVGTVMSVHTDGTNPQSYVVPTKREGGIWAPGGGVVDSDRLLYAIGNGEATGGDYDGSDSVVSLRQSDLSRTDLFTPSTWAEDNAKDLDLGSSNPIVAGGHVVVVGKRGTLYVLDASDLSTATSTTDVCPSLGSGASDGEILVVPCRTGGPKAVLVQSDGTVKPFWTASVTASGSPTIGGGMVWVVDPGTGILYELDEHTGTVRGQIAVGTAPHFASPTLSRDHAYIGLLDGVVAVAGV